MKLTWKIALAITVVICLVLGVDGYLRVHRQLTLFEEDIKRDHLSMGRATAAAVSEAWISHGEGFALELIERIVRKTKHVQIRWVDRSAPRELEKDMFLPISKVISSKQPISVIHSNPDEVRFLHTLIPVIPVDEPTGVIEISETLAPQKRFVRATIMRSIATTLVMIVICVVTTFVLGLVLVGRPVKALVEIARQIGEGNFGGRLEFKQNDEIAVLAREMNSMAERLERARRRIKKETTARLETLEQLRHADRLKIVGQLTSGVVHEIGTPLTVISGRGKMIATGEVEGREAQDCARIAVEQTERVTKTIRQILDFARKGNNQKQVEDIGQIAGEIVRLLGPVAVKGGIYLNDKTQMQRTAFSVVDRSQIQQVLANLVVNAVQATTAGGNVTVELKHRLADSTGIVKEDAEGYWALSVRDDGQGIDEEVMPHIFEPFYTTKATGSGTGLGLAISREIIRDHGGWIDVESEQGRGSCFTVMLPAVEGRMS